MRTIRRKTTILAALAVAAACGGGGGGGPSGPDGPDIRGTYFGTPPAGHAFEVRIGDDAPSGFGCPGAVEVTSSSGGTFGGAFRIDPCQFAGIPNTIRLAIQNGTVQEDGSVRFRVANQEAIIEGLQEEGCEELDVDEVFTGAVEGDAFSAAIEGLFDCPDPGGGGGTVEVRIRWAFDGTRSS